MVVVRVFRQDENVQIPEYQSEGASGFDLRATEIVILGPFEVKLIPTDLYLEIPENYEVQVRSRSGLALKNQLFVLNSPGTVDSDYRGEISVILYNGGRWPYTVQVGDRIAQAVVCPVVQAEFQEVFYIEELGKSTRGDRGFGSTGRN